MAVIPGTPRGEPLNGTAGNDTITGAGGADTIAMLGGNDLAVWNLGDGGDVVEGGAGTDTARFSSTGGFFFVSGGSGSVFVADGAGAGATIVDLNDVERLEFFANGFYNTVRVGDLSGTDVTKVTVNLSGANDLVAATATAANNTLSVTTAGKTANITGLPTIFTVANAEGSDVVELHGADGNDKLSGSTLGVGRLILVLHGDDGNDSLTGSVNNDGLDGGTGNDTVIGGRGNDNVLLGGGNDLFLWNVLDGFDTINGGGDVDTVRFTLSNADEGFSPTALDLEEVERVEIRTLGGADFLSVNNLTGTGITTLAIDLAATVGGKTADSKVDFIDIGPESTNDAYVVTTLGSKIMISGLGAEVSVDHAGKTDVLRITGGLGNDLIDASALAAGKITLELLGNSSNDTIKGSAGNDLITEAGGDDVVSAGAGHDVIDWTNGNGDDLIDGGTGFDRLILGGGILAVSGFLGHTLVNRSDGASIAVDDVERIESTSGQFTLGDVTGTALKQVAIDLSSGNGLSDNTVVTGSAGDDVIGATFAAGLIGVTGLIDSFTIAGAEKSFDHLGIAGGDGNDVIDTSKIAGKIDVGVDGGMGFDIVRFTGLAADEKFYVDQISLGQFGVGRTGDGTSIHGGGIERIEINALGGADTIEVFDPSSVGIAQVAIDLAATLGGKTADTKIDTVLLHGTGDHDTIGLSLAGSKIVRTGMPIELSIDHAGKTDRLVMHGDTGHDWIDASIVPAGKIALQLFGDSGDDTIWGSAGDDVIEGGFDNDFALLGAGNDLFTWFSGDGKDRVEGDAGTDTLSAFGTSASEGFLVLADAGKVQFHAQLESAVVELDNVERVQLNAAGGTDSILVGDLTGTDTKLVSVDLGLLLVPGGDGQTDILSAVGGIANETITATLAAGAVTIKGMAAQLSVTHVEAIDTIAIYGGEGNDTISVAAIPAKSGQFVLDGEEGNDKITGNLGNNVLYGSEGNDNLNGGGGNDTLYGGFGNDTITGGAGNDVIAYTSILDGHDVVIGFDGNAAGGQDVFDLDALFDSLGVAAGSRAGRVFIDDNGASVEISVDTDGNASFDLAVATLKTADNITVGQDIFVGT